MQPIGTITKYCRFLTADEQELLETIMDESKHYHDFVERLADTAMKSEIYPRIQHLAAILALYIGEPSIDDKIRSIDNPFVSSLSTVFFKKQGNQESTSQNEAHGCILDLLATDIEDWMRLHILDYSIYFMVDPVKRDEYLSRVKSLVAENPDLGILTPLFTLYEANRLRREGESSKALQICDNAISLARNMDDILMLGYALDAKASIVKDNDVREASKIIEEFHRLYAQLDYRRGISSAAADMGNIHFIMGEYDFALKFYLESAETWPVSMEEAGDYEYVFARIYNALGDYQEAMNWLVDEKDDRDSTFASRNRPLFHLAFAETQTLMGNREKARIHLDMARKLAFDSGDEVVLSLYEYLEGVYELTFGDVWNSLQSFESALEIAERLNFELIINQCLLGMTKAEVISELSSKGRTSSESSGQWMSRLERHAVEKNYTGVRMKHALLKAEYQRGLGELSKAVGTLARALQLSDSPGVETTRNEILKELEKISLILKS